MLDRWRDYKRGESQNKHLWRRKHPLYHEICKNLSFVHRACKGVSHFRTKGLTMAKKRVVVMVNDKDSCNISCAHCFLPFTGKRSPRETLQLVDRLRNDGYDVTIAGSETLMDPGYLAAYERAGQRYLLTNGLRLKQDPGLFDALQRYGITELRMSLHFGIQEALHSVPQRIVGDVCRDAKPRGFRVLISTTITPGQDTGRMNLNSSFMEISAPDGGQEERDWRNVMSTAPPEGLFLHCAN